VRALSKDVKEAAVTVMHVNAGQLQDAQQIRADDRRDVASSASGRCDPNDSTPRPASS
jgi:hypothetical protein